MSTRPRFQETEIKLPIRSLPGARRLLSRLGFRVLHRRTLEINVVFDTPDQKLRARKSLLRLRTAGPKKTLTFKGPAAIGRHKSRTEFEAGVDDVGAVERILSGLGYRPAFRYEKYRTEYRRPGKGGIVTIDETPVGNYFEVEGAARWIDQTAQALGYEESDYITASYGSLYLAYCRERKITLRDMIFRRRSLVE
jgi:adenylate cyclase, class 2